MSREYTAVIGSGQTPHVAHALPYSVTEGTYPVPDQRTNLRTRLGEGVIVLNPENHSVSIGLGTQAIEVTSSAVPLPATPLENRRAVVLHNVGPAILYIGASNVTTANGIPLAVDEKIAFDVQGTPNVTIYGVSAGTSDVRIMELA